MRAAVFPWCSPSVVALGCRVLALGCCALALGCERAPPEPASAPSPRAPTVESPRRAAPGTPPAERAKLTVPSTLRPGERRPFLLVLHGLGGSGASLAGSLGVARAAEQHRFVWVAPDGARGRSGHRFWNASSACCDLDGSGVDHVGVLRALLAEAARHPAVDPQRLFVLGFSNGGFMAHRLGCEAREVKAIVSLAGAGPRSDERCERPTPLAVLQVHGQLDRSVPYDGGFAAGHTELARAPSVAETLDGWARRNRCTGVREGARAFALGASNAVLAERTGCTAPVELWTLPDGDHFTALGPAQLEAMFAFLERVP